MKNYIITVNGVSYEVSVEELQAGKAPVAPAVQAAPAPVAPPAQAPVTPVVPAAPAAPNHTTDLGAIKVMSPMPGNILKVNVTVGQAVKKGDILVILEAMKMENEIMAGQDGTVVSVNVTKGAVVNAGDILVSLS